MAWWRIQIVAGWRWTWPRKLSAAAVGDAHRPAEPQGQQARVDLQADVLAGTERPADAAEHEADPLLREAEAGGDLLAVLVQPLRGDVQLDAPPVVVGDGHGRLEPEERLVLHADLVRALDDDVAGGVGVAAADHLVAEDVAVGMDRRVAAVDRRLGIDQRRQHLVRDVDRGERPAARLGVVGGDGGDRLADVAHVRRRRTPAGPGRSARTSAGPGTSAAVRIVATPGIAQAPRRVDRRRCGRTGAASAASPPTPRRRSAGPTRTRTCPGP